MAAARKAPKGDADTVKALKAARAGLEPTAVELRANHWGTGSGAKKPAFADAWNDLMTVSEFHKVAGKAEYVLDRYEILWGRYLLGLPSGKTWRFEYNGNDKNNDQLHMFVYQARADGKLLRQIKVWTYRWDTVYSGVGGENSKGLAKMMHELDRDTTAKSRRKVSPGVIPKKMNSEFPHANYYFVEGFDVDEEKTLRRDNYYVKGKNRSFNFEIITYLDPQATDDEVTKWQLLGPDPELDAVIETIVSNPANDSK